MGGRVKRTAHGLIRPAVDGLLERIRADADRIVSGGQDDEAVHDFRVGLRRLRTILRASRGIYGSRKVKRIEAAAKAFGDATSSLRDAEVLEDTLRSALLDTRARRSAATWLSAVRAGEADLRGAAVALIVGPELASMCAETRVLVGRAPKRKLAAGDYAVACFDEVRAGVQELLPVAGRDVDRLHRLRIRFKRLRYTSEMLAQFMTVEAETHATEKQRRKAGRAGAKFTVAARQAARMQKELGLLHDADQALASLAQAPIAQADRNSLSSALIDLRTRLVRGSLAQLVRLPPRIVGEGPVAITAEIPRLVRA